MKHLTKYLVRGIVGFWIAVGLFLGLQAIVWLIYPYRVVTIEEPIPILNENNEIAVGEPIIMFLKINKPRPYEARVNVNITCNSGNLITMTPLGRTLPAGNFELIQDSYTLPPKVATGDVCRFNFLNFYQVNPFKTISATWSSEDFKIVER